MFTKARKGQGGKVKYKYADIVASLAFVIYYHMMLKLHAEVHFKVEWSELKKFTDWLMDVPKNDRHSNLIDLFLWYTELEKKRS